MKVGKTKVAIKAPSQAIIRPTDRASVIRKGLEGLEAGGADRRRWIEDDFLIKTSEAKPRQAELEKELKF